jgi:hypothetical protein
VAKEDVQVQAAVAQEETAWQDVVFSCPTRPDMHIAKRRLRDEQDRPIRGEEHTTVNIPFVNGYAVATDPYEEKLLSSGYAGLGVRVYREDKPFAYECPECAFKTGHRDAMQEHMRGHIVG